MKTFLTANWENIIMANYAVDPKVLTPFLPKGVELDFYNGYTYVSLVGFMFKNTKLFKIPIPLLGTFEEINLRFYVTRIDQNELKRGVVFINETVPNKLVAWLANQLYKEHYTAIPTKHLWNVSSKSKRIEYQWSVNNQWNSIMVEAALEKILMQKNSFEEYIFEHYYGYTKINNLLTEEYKIEHPSWKIYNVLDFKINCSFGNAYGKTFEFLDNCKPSSVFIAEGSAIAVKWKRIRF